MQGRLERKAVVLVTGATGFFGMNLVATLNEDDRIGEIRVHARHPPPRHYSHYGPQDEPAVQIPGREWHMDAPVKKGEDPDERLFYDNPKVKIYTSDICNKAVIREAITGVDVVFHACGDTRWWNAINKEQHRVNVMGTLTVYEEALRAGVRVFVHTSTIDVLGARNYNFGDDEHHAFLGIGYNYCDTKYEAEEMLKKRHCGEVGTRLIIIRPGAMIGQRDVTRKYGRIFEQLKNGEIFCWPSGSTSVCSVQDVADAHVEAAFPRMDPTESGRFPDAMLEEYDCAGHEFTYEELFEAMRMCLNKQTRPLVPHGLTTACRGCLPPVYQTMPRWATVAYGWLEETWSNWVSGKEPELNPGMARYLSTRVAYISSKAMAWLGYRKHCPHYREDLLSHVLNMSYQWYARRGWF